MVAIKITRPGLVVNGPAAVIVKALESLGYKVEMESFEGQFQYMEEKNWPENEIDDLTRTGRQHGMTVKVEVAACPWGG